MLFSSVFGTTPIIDRLRNNVEVDEKGLATLLRVLELYDEAFPGITVAAPRLSFEISLANEIEALKEYIASLEQVSDDVFVGVPCSFDCNMYICIYVYIYIYMYIYIR